MTAGRRTLGFTVVELLVAMAVLGILLGVIAFFMTSTMRVTNNQSEMAVATADARLALFRVSEVARQASYVYPPDVEITVAGAGTFTTGEEALALLVPAGTTYCRVTGETYCGFLFYVGPRTRFVPPLRANGATNLALAELRAVGLEWPRSVVPALTITSWPAGNDALLADGVVSSGTDLGNDVQVTALQSVYDDWLEFTYTDSPLGARSLLNGVKVSLQLERVAAGRSVESLQTLELFARSVPRNAPPNLD